MLMKKIILIIFIFSTLLFSLTAQTSNSPYTIFGAGRIENNGFCVNESMGGTGFALRSDQYLNRINPASYSGIDSLSFIFEIGLFGKYSTYQTSRYFQDKWDGNLSYIAFGFRAMPWWAISGGILPYSSMGYSVSITDVIDGTYSKYEKAFTGSGSINQAYLGNSFRIFPNFSLGIHSSFVFGSFVQSESATLDNEYGSYTLKKTTNVSALKLDYGLQYFFKIKNWKTGIGIIYGNMQNLNSDTEVKFGSTNDTTDIRLQEKDNYLIPEQLGFGISTCFKDKLTIAFDYERKNWSQASFVNTAIKTRDSERLSMGIEYMPGKNSRSAIGFERLNYRLGASVEKTYLIIKNTPINSQSITLGVGIPLERKLSMINVGIEAGNLGTKGNGLFQENFIQLNVNFSLQDIWFQKPKYD